MKYFNASRKTQYREFSPATGCIVAETLERQETM